MSETTIVKRSGQAPLRIRGELVAQSASSNNNAHSEYSGSPGRSQAVGIFHTASGKYVAAVTHETCWQGERDSYEAAVFPSAAECIGYLRDRIPQWMLQDLIDKIGEENVAEDVD
jgi:hypothetical protein